MSEYVVIYEQAEDGGWGAYIPDLPGVVALGRSRAEASERIQEALCAYAGDLEQRGRTLPRPHHLAGTVATQPTLRVIERLRVTAPGQIRPLHA